MEHLELPLTVQAVHRARGEQLLRPETDAHLNCRSSHPGVERGRRPTATSYVHAAPITVVHHKFAGPRRTTARFGRHSTLVRCPRVRKAQSVLLVNMVSKRRHLLSLLSLLSLLLLLLLLLHHRLVPLCRRLLIYTHPKPKMHHNVEGSSSRARLRNTRRRTQMMARGLKTKRVSRMRRR